MLEQRAALRQMFDVEFPPDRERSFRVLNEAFDKRRQELSLEWPRRVDAAQVRRKEEMKISGGRRRRATSGTTTTSAAAVQPIRDHLQLGQNGFRQFVEFDSRC